MCPWSQPTTVITSGRRNQKAHELLLCIQTGKVLTDKDRLSFSSDQFYFKSGDEMERSFSQYPEAITNTLKIAEMCNLKIDSVLITSLPSRYRPIQKPCRIS